MFLVVENAKEECLRWLKIDGEWYGE